MTAEQNVKTQSAATGPLATLSALLRVGGSGAPTTTATARAGRVPALLGGVALALAATLLLAAAPALAAAPTVTIQPAAEVGFTTAQAKGTVDPAAHNTGYRFDFATQAQWEANGDSFNGAFTPGPGGNLAENSGEEEVEPILENLTAATTYHLRLYAENDQGEPAEAIAASTFTTQAATAPTLAVNAPEPSYLGAHLAATINPEGGNVNPIGPTAVPIAWDLQFSLTGEPGTWASAGGAALSGAQAESNAPIEVQGDATGLTPATHYVTRLVLGYAGLEQVAAEEPGFETLPVAKPTISINPVEPFTATTAHLSGEINPNAPEPEGSSTPAEEEAFATTYSFHCAPECPGLEAHELLAGNAPKAVSADVSGLVPGLPYEVTLTAANSGGEEPPAGPVQFTTEAVEPTIDATFATAVSETEATLKAKVNPGGAETKVHFDYITLEQFEKDGNSFGAGTKKAPEPDGAVGSNYEDHTVEATITGLTPNTAYRYRVVVTNEKSPPGGTVGPTKAFRTTSAGQVSSGCPNEALRRQNNSTALPDCRAYEQVSPLEKVGFDAIGRTEIQYPTQAAPSGEAIAYQGNGPFASGLSSLRPTAHLSTRTPSGWQTVDRSPPTPQGTIFGIAYYNFSEDLSQLTVGVAGQALAELPAGNEELFNLFLQKADGNYSLVNSVPPTEFAPEDSFCHEFEACYQFYDLLAFAGASRDFEHILFETNDSLVGTGAPGGEVPNLYESSGGQLHVVGFLPDGELAPSGAAAGAGGPAPYFGYWSNVDRAISSDGRRVLFESTADGGAPEPAQSGTTQLYDRIEGKETIEVSAPAPGATPANNAPRPARFWSASEDGSLVFFTSAAELTTPSNTGTANNSEDLYRYSVDTETLTDLSVDTNPADAATGAGVQGVVGASADGSYAYFVASGELIPGEGEDGQPNLYVSHGGQLEFITTLGEGDGTDWTTDPRELRSYLTPDGKHLALMSTKSLPSANFPAGYDNTDQLSGQPDSEVYYYSAPSGAEAGQLLCASCNPGGARPKGASFLGATQPALAHTAFHQPRAMSDSGDQLFFSSADSLAEGASGPFNKVYEYERKGAGSCGEEGGCLALISSPGAGTNDVFLDAGANGKDVFFATLGRPAASDTDGLYDVYDARVEGGFAPEVAKPPCEGEGCRGPAGSQPSSTAAASSAFNGPEEGPMHRSCAKGKVKRHGKCVNRRHKAKKHRSHKRAGSYRGGQK